MSKEAKVLQFAQSTDFEYSDSMCFVSSNRLSSALREIGGWLGIPTARKVVDFSISFYRELVEDALKRRLLLALVLKGQAREYVDLADPPLPPRADVFVREPMLQLPNLKKMVVDGSEVMVFYGDEVGLIRSLRKGVYDLTIPRVAVSNSNALNNAFRLLVYLRERQREGCQVVQVNQQGIRVHEIDPPRKVAKK